MPRSPESTPEITEEEDAPPSEENESWRIQEQYGGKMTTQEDEEQRKKSIEASKRKIRRALGMDDQQDMFPKE